MQAFTDSFSRSRGATNVLVFGKLTNKHKQAGFDLAEKNILLSS
jgi:hypothetical protein